MHHTDVAEQALAIGNQLPIAFAQYLDWTHGLYIYHFDEILKAPNSGHHFYEDFGWMSDHIYLSWDTNGEPTLVCYVPRCPCGIYHHELPRQYDHPDTAVTIIVGDEHIRAVPLRILTRFSRAAKKAFRHGTTDHACAALERRDSGVAEFCERSTSTKRIDKKSKTVFEVKLRNASAQSRKCHIDHVLDWMLVTDEFDNGVQLASDDYVAAAPLRSLVDLYAVATAFRLDPNPDNVLQQIRTMLFEKVSKADIEHINENLPVKNTVMTCAIMSFYVHLHSGNAVDDGQDVLDYVSTLDDGGYLSQRFAKLRCHMESRDWHPSDRYLRCNIRKAAGHVRPATASGDTESETEPERGASRAESAVEHTGLVTTSDEPSESSPAIEQSAASQSETSGQDCTARQKPVRRRKRREQQLRGKARAAEAQNKLPDD